MGDREDPSELMGEWYRDDLIASRCGFTVHLANEGLAQLKLFWSTVEEFIETEEEKDIGQLDQYAQKLPQHAREQYCAVRYPYWWQQIFATRLRSSLVISLMSAVEEHLNAVCRDTHTVSRSDIGRDDLKGTVIQRSRKYLEALAHFQAPERRLWELVGYLHAVRNLFVHNAGRLQHGRREKRLRHLMSQVPGLACANDVLEIRREFCQFAFSTVAKFFSELQSQLAQLCERAEPASGLDL